MVYADTNFFVAFMRTSDALHRDAVKLFEKYKGRIETSVLTLAELLAGCEKYGTDPEHIVGSVFQISEVSGVTLEEAMRAAHYMKERGLTAFDALHCSMAGSEIISADAGMDRTGIERIW